MYKGIETVNMTNDEAVDFLAHYGVLGMRWGVRKDRRTGRKKGSPIAGTKRARRSAPSISQQRKKQKAKAASMTDKELRQQINRLNMEREYVRLTSPQKSAGRKAVEQVLSNAGKQVATQFVANSLKGTIDKQIKKSK